MTVLESPHLQANQILKKKSPAHQSLPLHNDLPFMSLMGNAKLLYHKHTL